jgi:methylmalonyl-CoA/ethylmalonyl-CoA epimerase
MGGALITGLHHVGIVVDDIPTAADAYMQRYGWRPQTGVIHDATQTALVQFFQIPGDSMFHELVSPDSDQSKLTNSLRKGGGLNHLCYGTTDIEAACQQLRHDHMVLLQEPVAAVAFPGRRIAWLMGRDRTPIELVEWWDRSVL